MKNIVKNILKKLLFKGFFEIELTNTEKNTAEESLSDKYVNGLMTSAMLGILSIPAILFLDVSLLVSVLIPITMVSGTAWFAVSLVNIKRKFENFGNDLTKDLYRSFCTSLVLLSLIALASLNSTALKPLIELGQSSTIVIALSGVIGTLVVLKMIYDVFSGATKYDMNDSMLTGQNESAERYFRKSLSLLNSCATNLRLGGQDIGVTAYYFSLAFYEVFSYIKTIKGEDTDIDEALVKAESLKLNPPTSQDQLVSNTTTFIELFVDKVSNIQEKSVAKSIKSIKNEIVAVKNNGTSLALFNLRLSTILDEVEDLLVSQGEALFIKRTEIERRFLISKDIDLGNSVPIEIKQGYIEITSDTEERVRSMNTEYYHTIKKTLPSGYREETEKRISAEEFNTLWQKTEGHRLVKTRYKLPLGDYTAEVDIFGENNTGLKIVEVEFPSENEANRFVLPDWFGEEVTFNKPYKNQSLAR